MARPEQKIALLKKRLNSQDKELGRISEAYEQKRDQHERTLSLLNQANADLVTREYLLGVAINALRPFAEAAPDFHNTNGCILNPTMHRKDQHHLTFLHLDQAARAMEIFQNNLQPEVRKEGKTTMQAILAMLAAILSLQRTRQNDQTAIQNLQQQVNSLNHPELQDPLVKQQLDAVLANAANQPPETATAQAPQVGTIGQQQPASPQPQASERTNAQNLGEGGSSPVGAPGQQQPVKPGDNLQAPEKTGADTGAATTGETGATTDGGAAASDTGAPGAAENPQPGEPGQQ